MKNYSDLCSNSNCPCTLVADFGLHILWDFWIKKKSGICLPFLWVWVCCLCHMLVWMLCWFPRKDSIIILGDIFFFSRHGDHLAIANYVIITFHLFWDLNLFNGVFFWLHDLISKDILFFIMFSFEPLLLNCGSKNFIDDIHKTLYRWYSWPVGWGGIILMFCQFRFQ